MTRDDPVRQKYVDAVGHEPPVDESDLAWQWDYRGTKSEREELLERLDMTVEDDQPPQEETLFEEER